MNRFMALILVVILAPIFILLGILIMIFDGRPIFFKQKRVGQYNNLFLLYKFRTMKNNIGDIPTHKVKAPAIMVTKIGFILRKYSLDELPQIINIIKGQMGFIGHRPALYNQDYLIDLRTKTGVHTLIPGVTGWAQVNGRDNLPIPEKVKLDEYYLQNKSLWLNIKILFMTGVQVLYPKGVSH